MCVLQVNAEHSYAMMSAVNQDVLVDLFESSMRTNPAYQSDVSCFQSTQVSRSDVAGGTVVVKPDFPLSPLHCAALVVPANSEHVVTSQRIPSAASLRSELEVLTVTAAQSHPTTIVINSTEAYLITSQPSDVATFPSVVYDRVRNLFGGSDNEVNSNSLSDKLPRSTSSDTGQQNSCDGEVVTGSGEVICTTTVTACSSDSSPLESSYVDAGRMAYTESDVNVLAKVPVVNANEVPVVTSSCTDSSPPCELRIENVRSLQDDVVSPDITQSVQSPCKEACVNGNFLTSKRALGITAKSPADISLAGSKRKWLLLKDKSPEPDKLFKPAAKIKPASKKRRLFKLNMLTEDMVVEENDPEHLSTADSVDAHAPAERNNVRNDNLPDCELVVMSGHDILSTPAVVFAPQSQTASRGQTDNNPTLVNCITNGVASSQNLVEAVGVEADAAPVAKLSGISLDKRTPGAKHSQIAAAETSQEIEMEPDAATVVSTSVVSLPVPSDRLCTVTSVCSLNPAVHAVSAEGHPRSNQILADENVPSDCVVNELLGSAERRTGISSAKDIETEVTEKDLPLIVAEVHRNDSAVTVHSVDAEIFSEILPAAAFDSEHSSLVRQEDGMRVCEYIGSDSVANYSRRDAAETSEVPECIITSLPTVNTNLARLFCARSKSLEEFGAQSLRGSADVKSTSFDSIDDDALLCISAASVTRTMEDCNIDWHSQNKKQTLSRKKFQRSTSMTRWARTSIIDQNKNTIGVVDHHGLSSETRCRENTGRRILLQNTNDSSSQSLLCAQKQSDYCLPSVGASTCRLSAVGTPFLQSGLCMEHPHVAEESFGYRPPTSTNLDRDIVPCLQEDGEYQSMQAEKHFPTNLIIGLQSDTSNTTNTEQAGRGLAAVSSSMSDPLTSGTAAETGLKQSLCGASNGSGKLTSLPTPKNSLTCYQPVNRSPPTIAGGESSLVLEGSQRQPNYSKIQVLA